MTKVTLRASGGLNKDLDPNNLPDGDYLDASNIVFDSGKNGGAGAIRMYESLLAAGIIFSGEVKATFQDNDGFIYVLERAAASGATATIYYITPALNSKTQILTYTHGITTDFSPDLKVIGTQLVWNYAESGTVLSFALTRTLTTNPNTYSATAISLANLKLAKSTPNNVVSIKKINASDGTYTLPISFLESNDFQFASRYQYDANEYSVLSNYSQMFKGEKGTTGYRIQYDWSLKPAYATSIELYVRLGNNGIWRRVDTAQSSTNQYIWLGDVYESLDIISSSTPYHAVPDNAKHIEVAKNRIFLANIQDDYNIVETNTRLTLSYSNESALASGSYQSYLAGGNVDATSFEGSYDGTGYSKPFANNSTYAVGLAYYDEALKTRGVEPKTITKFPTGKFTYPLIPNIAVAVNSGWTKPSWAKYIQMVCTKNISKSYVYEGFASNIYFELSLTETNPVTLVITKSTTISQSLDTYQQKNLRFMVVDIMGMLSAGSIYNFTEGDRITINTPNGILDLNIKEQQSNLLYCEYSGGVMVNPEIPVPKSLYFEIYTPKIQQEDESLLFYEFGSLVPITDSYTGGVFTGTGTLNSTKFIGDMVFSKIEIPVYETGPFLYNTEKTSPPLIVEDVITVVNGITSQTITSSLTNSGNASTVEFVPTLSLGANGDGASISSPSDAFKVAGFYDIGNQDASINKMSIAFNLASTNSLSLEAPVSPATQSYGSMSWSLQAQVFRTPYNNKDNKYEVTESFGAKFTIDSKTFSEPASSVVIPIIFTKEINLNTDIKKDISANDKFSVKLTLDFSANDNIAAGLTTISKLSSATYGMVITLNGDRTTPKVITSYNSDSTIAEVKQKFIIRSISNAVSNPYWNTSAGKPLVTSTTLNYPRRTNTIRYSGNYVEGTRVNNVNSFFALDSNDTPIENGEIMSLQRASRLQGNGAMLLAFSLRETCYVFLGEQELSQGNNATIRSLTANMIGTIRNMGNGFGLQDKLSILNYRGTIWWWDDFNKKICKYTEQGIEVPSDIYMRSYFLTKGGTGNSARICYDPFYNMCFVGFNSDGFSYGYSDNLKRWTSQYSFRTGFSESYGDKMVLFRDSVVYKSATNNYNSFFGTTYNSTISFLVNSRLPVNPLNIAIWHDMNIIDWNKATDGDGGKNYIKASLLQVDITNENGQATSVNEGNFIMEDNRMYAHIMRDTNTPNVTHPLIQGNYIVGYLTVFIVTLKDRSQEMRINSIDIEVVPVAGHS